MEQVSVTSVGGRWKRARLMGALGRLERKSSSILSNVDIPARVVIVPSLQGRAPLPLQSGAITRHGHMRPIGALSP